MTSQAVAVLVLLFVQLHISAPVGAQRQARPVSSPNPLPLVQCINDKRRDNAGTSWESAMRDQPANFVAVGAWWSSKSGRHAQVPLTIVTQMSTNRVTQLWSQCKSWRGPLSAAILLPLHQPTAGPLTARNTEFLKRTLKAMSEFHLSIEADRHACKLDIILVYEVYTEKRATMLYPVNQMRDLARLQARTELIALMDVDMLVSSRLSKSLQDPQQAALMKATCNQRKVYVTPAFETYGPDQKAAALEADKLSRHGKEALVQRVAKRKAAPFDSERFPQGHNTTDFERWYRTDKQYEVKYTERFEPWIIANRKAIPWHDVRFRGYGQNKIVHIAHTNASGFGFVVHPSGFIVHRAHELTAARTQLVADMKLDFMLNKERNKSMRRPKKEEEPVQRTRLVSDDTIYGHSSKLWEEAKRQMDQGGFKAAIDPATMHCLDVLPWWQ